MIRSIGIFIDYKGNCKVKYFKDKKFHTIDIDTDIVNVDKIINILNPLVKPYIEKEVNKVAEMLNNGIMK